MTIVSAAFRERIIVFMKPLSIMDARAARPITLATNYVRPASIATTGIIVGGMKTAIAGAPSTIGMTTIMIITAIVTAIVLPSKPLSSFNP